MAIAIAYILVTSLIGLPNPKARTTPIVVAITLITITPLGY
jgi:hypothetical protein